MTTSTVFVVGNSRSGTTMMGRVLGRHPAVHTFQELHFFEELYLPSGRAGSVARQNRSEGVALAARLLAIQREGYLSRPSGAAYQAEATAIVAAEHTPPEVFDLFLRYETQRNGKRIACEQTPKNLFYLDEILAAYPEARVVNMVRDPRDVMLSQKNRWRRRALGGGAAMTWEGVLRSWANYHPIVTARLWVSAVAAAERFRGHERVLFVSFEDMLADPHKTVQALCDFLRIEYHEDMLNVPRIGSSTVADRSSESGIDASRISSWRSGGLSASELMICERICAAAMQRLGYQQTEPRATALLGGWWQLATLPIKVGASLLVNLRNSRNLLSSVRRRLAF